MADISEAKKTEVPDLYPDIQDTELAPPPGGATSSKGGENKTVLFVVLGCGGIFFLLAVVGVLAALLSGPLMRAKRAADRTSDMNSVKQIAMALYQFDQTEGRAPHSWKELVDADYITTPELFRSVLQPRETPLPHFMIAPYYRADLPDQAVILWAIPNPEDEEDGGVVAFKDLSVQYISAPYLEYLDLVEALETRTNPKLVRRLIPGADVSHFSTDEESGL